MDQSIINGYAEEAKDLIPAFEAISSSEVLANLADFLPNRSRCVIEIGAGTGRDAAWLASHGCHVLAVEPVAQFREAGMSLHPTPHIEWVDDSLPSLKRILQRGEKFDLTLLVAVWQHVEFTQRLPALRNLRSIAYPGGRLIISVRHGPGSPKRKRFPINVSETVDLARQCGFKLLANRPAKSVQGMNRNSGVTWAWLVFEAA
jgi:SAM-dependent methyltransferase